MTDSACVSCDMYQAMLLDLKDDVDAATGDEQQELREQLIGGTLMYGSHVMSGHVYREEP